MNSHEMKHECIIRGMFNKYKVHIIVVLLIVVAIFCILCISVYLKMTLLQLQISFAHDQVKIFKQMHEIAENGNPSECAGALDYTINYYPGGKVDRGNSNLIMMIESAREHRIKSIISILKKKTNEDLGDDPEVWIKKYNRKQ